MATLTVHCPCCQSYRVYRHGKSPASYARYRCLACHYVWLCPNYVLEG
ncbi:IS1 family transposase [Aeromonas hydrophila]